MQSKFAAAGVFASLASPCTKTWNTVIKLLPVKVTLTDLEKYDHWQIATILESIEEIKNKYGIPPDPSPTASVLNLKSPRLLALSRRPDFKSRQTQPGFLALKSQLNQGRVSTTLLTSFGEILVGTMAEVEHSKLMSDLVLFLTLDELPEPHLSEQGITVHRILSGPIGPSTIARNISYRLFQLSPKNAARKWDSSRHIRSGDSSTH